MVVSVKLSTTFKLKFAPCHMKVRQNKIAIGRCTDLVAANDRAREGQSTGTFANKNSTMGDT